MTIRHAMLPTLAMLLVAGMASAHPVTVESCGRPLSIAEPPARAVAHNQNISEIMLPELAPKYPTLENLLAVDPDFFFAGWYYGMQPGGEVTPDTLAAYGVPVYVLTESCIHVDKGQPRASLDLLYADVANIGGIFDADARAAALIEDWRSRVAAIEAAIDGRQPVPVFLYDSGEDKPFTAGRYAMPTALIEAAGGQNIMDDVETSWGTVAWEAVIERDPAFIVLVDYDQGAPAS
jgi:iron complex transport system substrate-binding protein